jgi:5-methylcytosine-specific restriction endonuclease McrA
MRYQIKYDLQEVLEGKHPKYTRHSLKKRLITEGYMKHECVECGQKDTHNGKPLTLQLDHINGVNNDHRLENLRLLCPNCHTQQDTYAGKNNRKYSLDRKSFAELKLLSDKEKWEKVLSNPDIRINEWGWTVRVGNALGISPQKVAPWFKRVDPDYKRK